MARNVEDIIGSSHESGGKGSSGDSRGCSTHSDCPPKKMCWKGKCIDYKCLKSYCPDDKKWDSGSCSCKPKDIICKAPKDWDDEYTKADYAIAALKSLLANCSPITDGLSGSMVTIGGIPGYGKCYGDPVMKYCTEITVMKLSGGKWVVGQELALFYLGSEVVDCSVCTGAYYQATIPLFWGGFDLEEWVNGDPAKRLIKL